MDSLLSKKRKEESASSSSFSPTGPTLESPTTFQLSTTRPIVPEATIKPKTKSERVAAMPSMFLEEKEVDEKAMMDLDRGAPADPAPVSVAHESIEEEETAISKQKYFEEAFATRGQRSSSRSLILHNSILVVEMEISTRVGDDASLATDIASRLAPIYQRPLSHILVTLQQDACVKFGYPHEPAYLMKITALKEHIAPVTNMRNTVLVQSSIQDVFHIEPRYGVIIFNPVDDENFGTNGATAHGQLFDAERPGPNYGPRSYHGSPRGGIFKSISRSMSRRLKSSSTNSNPLSVATTSSWSNTPETQGPSTSHPGKEKSSESESKDEGKTVKKTKSIRQFVRRHLEAIGPAEGVQMW
ncbi:MIF domain protein [Aspergillus sclerotialis]|uniref:L-dopachrome isomerase n=1 Tax=Aspergillus sclerotialis TaxID=2070753 RepID=A0A3A2ZCR2_9EURO|nr:MIF domain protein [Aspergillus sclerotialis]